jgi:hypothetical protein
MRETTKEESLQRDCFKRRTHPKAEAEVGGGLGLGDKVEALRDVHLVELHKALQVLGRLKSEEREEKLAEEGREGREHTSDSPLEEEYSPDARNRKYFFFHFLPSFPIRKWKAEEQRLQQKKEINN